MNILDVLILIYKICFFFKFAVNVSCSIALLVLSSISITMNEDVIHMGMIVASTLSLFYVIRTMLLDINIEILIYEVPRLFILAWAIYSSVVASYLHVEIALMYVVAFLNLFFLRLPYGDDGELRV
jgi:hypothetical protein